MEALPPSLQAMLKRIDVVQPKVYEDVQRSTSRGGWLTLVSLVICAVFAVRYLTRPDEYVERIAVDTDIGAKMRVHVNITFDHLACSMIDLIVMEYSGEVQLSLSKTVHKTRLRNGKPLVGGAALETAPPTEACGSCYGAERFAGDCCHSCQDVKERYSEKSWDENIVTRTAKQCLAELDHPDVPVVDGEGCVLAGTVTVNKVDGHMHIALGASRVVGGNVVHTFSPDKIATFDTSHVVNSLRFGDVAHPVFTGAAPLDGFAHPVDVSLGRTASMQYLVSLIPTLDDKGNMLYRFTSVDTYSPVLNPLPENLKPGQPMPPNRDIKLPGVYFLYEFSPFVVVRRKLHVSWLTVLIDLFGLVGGVIMSSRLLDAALHMAGA